MKVVQGASIPVLLVRATPDVDGVYIACPRWPVVDIIEAHGVAPFVRAMLPAPVSEPEDELARLDPRWIRYGPFTLSGLVTTSAALAVPSPTHAKPDA